MKIQWMLLTGVILLGACASRPVFKPEIDGPGAKSFHGAIVYSVPPKNPVLKMRLTSVGVTKKNMLLVRMFFLRKGAPAGEYLDPKEQAILLPNTTEKILPSKIHASIEGKPMIKLAGTPKQAIELLFPLPSGSHEYPFVKLNWKLHYTQSGIDKTMSEVERFDLVEKDGVQEGVGNYYGDADFPYGFTPVLDDWFMPGWAWW